MGKGLVYRWIRWVPNMPLTYAPCLDFSLCKTSLSWWMSPSYSPNHALSLLCSLLFAFSLSIYLLLAFPLSLSITRILFLSLSSYPLLSFSLFLSIAFILYLLIYRMHSISLFMSRSCLSPITHKEIIEAIKKTRLAKLMSNFVRPTNLWGEKMWLIWSTC